MDFRKPVSRRDKNEIKVAAIGLKRCHLGQRLANVRNHLEKLKNQFGVHPAGEGACSRTSTFTPFLTLSKRHYKS